MDFKDLDGVCGEDNLQVIKLTDEAAVPSEELQMIKAEAKVMVGELEDARNILLSLRCRYEQSVSGRPEEIRMRALSHRYWYVKSLVAFYGGTLDSAISKLNAALEFDPGNSKTSLLKNKLTLLNDKFTRVLKLEEQLRGQTKVISKGSVDQLSEEKFELLMVCLNNLVDIQKILPRRNELILSRIFRLAAEIRNNENSKMYDIVSAYRFVNLAIKLNPSSLRNFSMKGNILGKVKQYRHAIVELQIYARHEQSNPEVKLELELCKKALYGTTTKKYYRILGLQPTCTAEDIKLARKTLYLLHHPDKNMEKSAEEMDRQVQTFQYLLKIVKILLDPVKRKEYNDAQNSDDEDYPPLISLDDLIEVPIEDEAAAFVNSDAEKSKHHRSARTELSAFF